MRRGRPPYPDLLTPREQEVLALLREGLSNPQIADRLGISRFGVKYHVSEIISKLGVSTREEAAAAEVTPGRRWPALALAWLGWKRLSIAGAAFAAAAAAVIVSVLLFRDASTELGTAAFIRDGNLWVKALPDGPERQLTSQWGAVSPQWSPSGEWVLYFQGPPATPEDIGAFVIRADGTEQRRLDSVSASWSPVDDVLALSLPDSSLVIENADGSGRRQVLPPIAGRTANPLDRRLEPFWSRDGAWLLFEEHHADHERAATYAYIGMRAVRVDGSDEHEVFSTSFTPEGHSDGRMPASWGADWNIGVPTFVWLMPASGTEPSEANGIPLALMTAAAISGPSPTAAGAMSNLASQTGPGVPMLLFRDAFAVSPDGGRIALVEGVSLGEVALPHERSTIVDDQTDKRIAVMDLQTGEVRVLTASDLVAASPAWSPDGGTIAFVARPDTGPVQAITIEGDSAAEQPRRLWTMHRDGSDASEMEVAGADCRQERPQWSRDGKMLLFICLAGPEAEAASVWVVPAAGGTAQRVVDEVSLLIASGPQPAFPARAGHINWTASFDWWQP